MTLQEGQYQIGSLVFGQGTMYQCLGVELTGYTSQVGDVPIPDSDEIRFRKDFFQPSSIQFSLGVLDNYALVGGATITDGDSLLEALHKEWRADEIRKIWGYTKPLIYCRNEVTRRVYGRPRDFSSSARRKRPGWYDVVMTYQRADTVVYDDETNGVLDIANGAAPTPLVRGDGLGPTWMEIYITGPGVNPTVKVGPYTIELNYTLAALEVVQINSYPWERRAISSNGQNISAKMIGNSPYLNELSIPPGASYNVELDFASGATGASQLDVLWREAWLSF